MDHLMTMVSQRQQYFWSFALNQSHDRKQGGGMMWSRWIWWWSMSWIDWGGYDGSLGALNSAKYSSCLPLSCQWIHFSPKSMYGSGEPLRSTLSPMAYDLLRAGWDCMVWSWASGRSWGVLWMWLVSKINICIIIIWIQWPSWHQLKTDRVWWHIDDNDGQGWLWWNVGCLTVMRWWR